MVWNISEAIYQIAISDIGQRPALIYGDQRISYKELVRRASGFGSWLQSLELPAGAHVGHYMRNSNAYMETFTAAGLVGMTHVNVNYRYLDKELIDLCNGLDIRVLVYDAEFADCVAAIKDQLDVTVGFVETGAAPAVNSFARTLTDLYDWDASHFQRSTSSDDLIILATGGTTGLPKGTQWRHEDLWRKQKISRGSAMLALRLEEHPATIEEHIGNVLKLPVPTPFMPLSPLMHGAASLMAILMLAQGTPVLTVPGIKFNADLVLDLIMQYQVAGVALVGDAFAIPLLEALDRRYGERPLASLTMMISTGASLSEANRRSLLRHQPNLVLFDTLGSSEAAAFAVSTPEAGVFKPMASTRVFDDELNIVEPGSGVIGIAYSGGYSPVGYYKQPKKSADTFLEIAGVRYVKTGDRCIVREDGMLILLGRDSTVINTGGEKVYTVEIERVLIDHPDITDALVVGLADERFGNIVIAVVEGPHLTEENLDIAGIQHYVSKRLADYKVPRKIFAIKSLQRGPNGKPDYPFIQAYAAAQASGDGLH
ncbi:MAG: AMP-binding protein [Halioglobus sp.]|nr:AMP-binding protein [Halioglobus sp.]